MLRGYDIDGVLLANGNGIKPVRPYVVISGRIAATWEQTIREIGTDAPIYLQPNPAGAGDHRSAAEWKAEIINKLGVEEFFEDTPFQAEIIRSLSPKCQVFLVTWEFA